MRNKNNALSQASLFIKYFSHIAEKAVSPAGSRPAYFAGFKPQQGTLGQEYTFTNLSYQRHVPFL
jgi:hypothetical protein